VDVVKATQHVTLSLDPLVDLGVAMIESHLLDGILTLIDLVPGPIDPATSALTYLLQLFKVLLVPRWTRENGLLDCLVVKEKILVELVRSFNAVEGVFILS
jgi:hypothetical protein